MSNSTLVGPDLDREVARLRGMALTPWVGYPMDDVYSPSSDWEHCGEIMSDHNMATEHCLDSRGQRVRGDRAARAKIPYINGFFNNQWVYGPTVQVAVCRCFVAFAQEREEFNSKQEELFT